MRILYLSCKLNLFLSCRIKLSSYIFILFYRPKCWIGNSVRSHAPTIDEGTTINCNGAGDAFTSGFLIATLLRKIDSVEHDGSSLSESLSLEAAAQFAALVALKHICSSTRDSDCLIIENLLEIALCSQALEA